MNSAFALFTAATIGYVSAFDDARCHLPLDVMFLQDTTGSFIDDLPNVMSQLTPMTNEILKYFSDSQFGVAEFKDKPYFPLGEADDFCYKLGFGALSANMDDFQYAYSVLYASGGADEPEAQFQALINVALDQAVGWRPLALAGKPAKTGEAGARVVIISTDATIHLPGDANKYSQSEYPDIPHDLPANFGNITNGDVDYACNNQDYPKPEQAYEALAGQGIYVVILTPNVPAVEQKVVDTWKYVNTGLLGQPDEFYQFINADSSNLLEGVLNGLKKVTEVACETISTPAPTTAPATTTGTTLMPTTTGTDLVTPYTGTAPEVTGTTGTDLVTPYTGTAPEVTGTTASSGTGTACPEHPCPGKPCDSHCPEDECNKGVIIKISDQPKHVNITIQ